LAALLQSAGSLRRAICNNTLLDVGMTPLHTFAVAAAAAAASTPCHVCRQYVTTHVFHFVAGPGRPQTWKTRREET